MSNITPLVLTAATEEQQREENRKFHGDIPDVSFGSGGHRAPAATPEPAAVPETGAGPTAELAGLGDALPAADLGAATDSAASLFDGVDAAGALADGADGLLSAIGSVLDGLSF